MSHSDLDAFDNFLEKRDEEGDLEWDIEDLKQSYIEAAEQQWDKFAGG
jgi:hypothetical protein|tara:strand:+ start:126 stop:269 length:144 start_codon:yes stop_codon:yes gene_type:complete